MKQGAEAAAQRPCPLLDGAVRRERASVDDMTEQIAHQGTDVPPRGSFDDHRFPLEMQSRSVIVREVEGELLILDTQAGRIHQLNATAALVWRRLNEGKDPEAVAVELTERFEIDLPTARADVGRTIEMLRSEGLVFDTDGDLG